MSNAAPPQLAKKMLRKKVGGMIAQQMAGESGAKNREKESAAVVQKLLANEWFRKAKRLSVYISNEKEICTDDVVRNALKEGKELFIPRFTKGAQRMEMLRLESEKEFESLECTLWGIRQHCANLSPPTFEETAAGSDTAPLDLVVMPGMAFTTCGKRLGHGRGFYDRFLNEYAQKYGTVPRTIGLALKVQLVDDLPMESKDRMMDKIIHA